MVGGSFETDKVQITKCSKLLLTTLFWKHVWKPKFSQNLARILL